MSDSKPTTSEEPVFRVVMFVDLVDCTALKTKHPEAFWLTQIKWFLDLATRQIDGHQGTVAKYLGDGVMAVFAEDHAAEAINAAVRIQEELDAASAAGRYNLSCSIGISAGSVVPISPPAGGEDYIGSVVDCAARLCSHASGMAVFVDENAIASAIMSRITSKMGTLQRRTPSEYQGNPQKAELKGLGIKGYHEIRWNMQLFGVKSQALTATVEDTPRTITRPAAETPERREHEQVLAGVMRKWNTEREHGFIACGEEFFYFDRRFLACGAPPAPGAKVYFVPRDPVVAGKNRVAACVATAGEHLQGKLAHVNAQRRFGFIEFSDDHANTASVFCYLGDDAENLTRGEAVEFVVGDGARGPSALSVQRAQDPYRAAA